MRTRVLAVALLLVLTAAILHSRTRPEKNPPRLALATFPGQLGPWSGTNLPIADDVRQILGPGDFLDRVYSTANGPSIELFIAYFPSQRAGDTIHSPKNCLPGAGWIPVRVGRMTIPGAAGQSMRINRYIVAKGQQRQLVLYWYQAHNRVTASEYWAKWYLISDSIRLNRTDGALVRVMTPREDNESMADAQRRALSFVDRMVPLLNNYIPR